MAAVVCVARQAAGFTSVARKRVLGNLPLTNNHGHLCSLSRGNPAPPGHDALGRRHLRKEKLRIK
jgi:hypothetical protein